MKDFNQFREEHPILLNSILIALAAVAVVYIALLFIDVFTAHGEECLVPNVRNMSLEQAIATIEQAGLKWEISDSTNYDEQFKPGSVIDQDPVANSYIKSIRTIYLRVNAMEPRKIALPKLGDGSVSMRNGLANLRALGFKNVEVDSVAGPEAGLIISFTVDGKHVAEGSSVSQNARIVLTVSDGSVYVNLPDSVLSNQVIDSIEASHDFYDVDEVKPASKTDNPVKK